MSGHTLACGDSAQEMEEISSNQAKISIVKKRLLLYNKDNIELEKRGEAFERGYGLRGELLPPQGLLSGS